jgi:hypothetical protein
LNSITILGATGCLGTFSVKPSYWYNITTETWSWWVLPDIGSWLKNLPFAAAAAKADSTGLTIRF